MQQPARPKALTRPRRPRRALLYFLCALLSLLGFPFAGAWLGIQQPAPVLIMAAGFALFIVFSWRGMVAAFPGLDELWREDGRPHG